MVQERLVIPEHDSAHSEQTGLIVSAVQTFSDRAEIVVGRPGLPNMEATLGLGGAVLFETPDGLFEVRVLSTSGVQVQVLVTQISPRPGIAAGYVDQAGDNAPFLPEELERIATSIDQIRSAMRTRADLSSEQLRYLSDRLEEMRQASERLGRKDWVNLAVGTLTSIVVSAAFDPAAARTLLQAAGTALSWVFGGGLKLLP